MGDFFFITSLSLLHWKKARTLRVEIKLDGDIWFPSPFRSWKNRCWNNKPRENKKWTTTKDEKKMFIIMILDHSVLSVISEINFQVS